MENKNKREFRELSDEHKSRIANANKNKPKSAEHRMHISQSMEKYWSTVPSKPQANNNDVKPLNNNGW